MNRSDRDIGKRVAIIAIVAIAGWSYVAFRNDSERSRCDYVCALQARAVHMVRQRYFSLCFCRDASGALWEQPNP